MPKKAVRLIDVLVIIVVFLLLIVILLPWASTSGPRELSKRGACSSNLKSISTQMYEYSQNYNGAFPAVSFGTGEVVGEDKSDKCLKFNKKNDPRNVFLSKNDHSFSQNMWLLVRDDFIVAPEIFTCPSTKQFEQKINFSNRKRFGPEGFVDFPWKDTGATISYSFIQPWSKFTENVYENLLFCR
jgi:hypothetical protein